MDIAPVNPILRKISPSYRFAALALGGISIFLFGVDALIFQQEYRIA
jgi:hypothetical protein